MVHTALRVMYPIEIDGDSCRCSARQVLDEWMSAAHRLRRHGRGRHPLDFHADVPVHVHGEVAPGSALESEHALHGAVGAQLQHVDAGEQGGALVPALLVTVATATTTSHHTTQVKRGSKFLCAAVRRI